MARLASHVHVADDKGAWHVFGPSEDVPAWAQKAISNPDAWADEPEGGVMPAVGDSEELAKVKAELEALKAQLAARSSGASGPAAQAVPPRGGAGSGVDVWVAYAGQVGVEVPEGASRDDVIAAIEKAGKPVE